MTPSAPKMRPTNPLSKETPPVSLRPPPAIVAVDWGTSSLRIWLMDDAGTVIAERRSPEGMEGVGQIGFEGGLRARLADIGIDPDAGANRGRPVVMCGMVGARQGWCEAPYVD